MRRLLTYLTFDGNCREAMEFYQQCLGGALQLQTVGESPMAEHLPEPIKAYVLQASLCCDDFILMGTDMVGEEGLKPGNAVSIMIECVSEKEMRNCYLKLSREGRSTHPIKPTFWGGLFGGLTDKFGNHWLFHCKI